ncbi:hypothetical protein Lgee_2050 [Legionella geestiana]|uniref:Transmembrane protein n=2 Tax=Legionella geestiana TaxID=45065 RepID=A0A0W0TNA1_9GAMM|nr:hypothetical protein Lgee_2050 [Legionella geestiana]STX53904.1 Uncharacterised protein [Legionella geestiana]
MPDTAPQSPAKAFFAENFLNKIMKKPRAAAPSAGDWLRGFSGWPHPESAGSVESYVFFPFEGMLNLLKLFVYITPAIMAMRLMDDTLMPMYEDALDSISGQEASMHERGRGLLKLLTCAPLLLLMSTFAAVALTGGCLTATSDMFEKAHAFGTKLHPKLGSLFGGHVFFLAIIIHVALGLEIPSAIVGVISLKLLSFCNQSLQNGATGKFKVSYAAAAPSGASSDTSMSLAVSASPKRSIAADSVTLPLFKARELQNVTDYGAISRLQP